MVEFVSANPTGPLHVGHGRQAALGDAICNLLRHAGLGRCTASSITTTPACRSQTLATSTQLRAKGFKPGDAEWPEHAYNGEYIADIADDFLAKKTVQVRRPRIHRQRRRRRPRLASASSPWPTCATSRTWT